MPYRGSQVLLAYNSDKVAEADVPKTFPGPRGVDQEEPRPVRLLQARQGRLG